MEIGRGVRLTVGRGLATNPGDGLLITTAAGSITTTTGPGCRAVDFHRRRSWWRPALVAFVFDISFGHDICWYPLSYYHRDPYARNYRHYDRRPGYGGGGGRGGGGGYGGGGGRGGGVAAETIVTTTIVTRRGVV